MRTSKVGPIIVHVSTLVTTVLRGVHNTLSENFKIISKVKQIFYPRYNEHKWAKMFPQFKKLNRV